MITMLIIGAVLIVASALLSPPKRCTCGDTMRRRDFVKHWDQVHGSRP